MNSAEVVDILRGSQRDNLFVNDIQDDLQSLYKVLGPRNYQLRQTAPIVANAWYYLITSLGNVQTLGEEYTGTIRLTKQNTIPTKLVHSMWLLLYVGGEPLLERLILKLKSDITNSTSLTHQAQAVFLGILNFLSSNKSNLKRIHQALFYINGRYYNVSNRITGIRYGLVRPWLKDDTFSGSFNCLGYISLFYTLFSIVHDLLTSHSGNSETLSLNYTSSTKCCPLCTENLKSASATPCGHIFCWTCIHDSLAYQKCCPICREDISPNRIYYLQNYM
ncbi:peroxisome biogenesis factor 10 [Aethina tumida]|uniref:peroxisome biogenesis factor 10 n=1 Tax=Aethina tumida TaxID=116153 RepID=UPI00096AE951|nr:peroxisome biogenesis factor 10 [Aethina tumida]